MTQTVHSRMSSPEAKQLVRRLVYALAGKTGDLPAIVRGIQLRAGMAQLSRVQSDFITKSRGGVGSDGIKWQPLKRSTIAGRRTTAGERKALGIGGKRERGLLTPAENRRWKLIFATRKARLMAKFGLSGAEAGARAAGIAWTILKGEGAKTRLAVLGGRQVDILRDTGELLRSFSPGVDGNILRADTGAVRIGTNKKTWHHAGTAKLPARLFWPDGDRHPFPPGYLRPANEAARRGVLEAVVRLVGGAA